jgi:hypothetical protein
MIIRDNEAGRVNNETRTEAWTLTPPTLPTPATEEAVKKFLKWIVLLPTKGRTTGGWPAFSLFAADIYYGRLEMFGQLDKRWQHGLCTGRSTTAFFPDLRRIEGSYGQKAAQPEPE